LEREVNLQQNPYNTSHHNFSMLPHYLVKSEVLAYLEENANKNVTCIDF